MAHKICRFKTQPESMGVGALLEDGRMLDLTPAGITSLEDILEHPNPDNHLSQALTRQLPEILPGKIRLCAPVERQEVWAAGVTYLRSKTARMEESDFSATAYDRVYLAERPELFFKALPEKVAATDEPVGIRKDARWSVPEPELALVLNSRGQVVGYTIGNDMSSRDIEGENLLYLPQAKIYERSCALGPWIALGSSEAEARQWQIRLQILRNGKPAFSGETSVNQLKRRFQELADFLFRSQVFPHGAVLLTGTGVVPPDNFTLRVGDIIEIEISGIGKLRNTVALV
jgi:2-dehydro-3-deoxy-D-arabinonate dehydratase